MVLLCAELLQLVNMNSLDALVGRLDLLKQGLIGLAIVNDELDGWRLRDDLCEGAEQICIGEHAHDFRLIE